MIRTSFNADWVVGPKNSAYGAMTGARGSSPQTVTLPHDAVRDLPRTPMAAGGSHTGWAADALVTYRKTFDVPEEWRDRVVVMEFEGVYRDAMVYVNRDFAAQRPNGYAGFAVPLDGFLRYGEKNEISVDVRTHRDSRWYTGAGIHRNVHLLVGDLVHVAPDGLRITTPDIDPERAIVMVTTTVRNTTRLTRTVRLHTELRAPDGGVVTGAGTPVTLPPGTEQVSRIRLPVPGPRLWGPGTPHLYEAHVRVCDDGRELDRAVEVFGIRRLQVDADHGLRINGVAVDLRGACVHHDNGPLGAAAVGRAEERRVELLQEAGFNAIRSAHNPLSRSMLSACDRLGMLVMDELTDVWTETKTPFDYALAFPEWWERDVEAMVAKDLNHPCVVMYSIGNESFEVGRPLGSAWGRRLAEKVRSLDDTRFVTNALNGLVATLDDLVPEPGGTSPAGKDVNTLMSSLGDMMNRLSVSERVTSALEESAGVLDVVGLNYAERRYALDAETAPHRVLVGSETFPGHIAELWRLVRQWPHVIGDFTWTGWDYLGEAGLGRHDYREDGAKPGVAASFPYLLARTGDIDITGRRRTVSYYREVVFGLRQEPYLAVHRPQHHGKTALTSAWSWSDSLSSWSWDVPEGSPVTVDVYSAAEEIELRLDGRCLGRAPAGQETPFLTRFETEYRAGELTAVAYADGIEQARTSLRSAGPPAGLRVHADRTALRADHADLAFLDVVLVDEVGTVVTDRDQPISIEVEGPVTLAALGSSRPAPEGSFADTTCLSYEGHALAVLRPTGVGQVRVTAASGDLPLCSVELDVAAPDA